MQLILKRKQFATYGVNNNFTSVSYSPGSIQANPSATTMTSTGRSYRPPRSLDSYANPNSPKGKLSHVALPPLPPLRSKRPVIVPRPLETIGRETTSSVDNGRYFQRDHVGPTPNPMSLRQRVQRQAELSETFGLEKKSSPLLVKRPNGYAAPTPSPITLQQHSSRRADLEAAFSKLPKPSIDGLRALVGK